MTQPILKTTGFLFTETSITLDLLKADFGDGYKAGALVGAAEGLRTWTIKIDVLPDDLEYAPPVSGTDETRANYLWEFYLSSKQAGDDPFWIEDMKTGKWHLAEFVDDSLTYPILCAKVYATGLQLRQRRMRGQVVPAPAFGLIYRDAFNSLEGWTNQGGWAIDSTVPAVVAHATSDPSVSFSGIPNSFDAMGVREGGIMVEGDTWFMWYDSGNGKSGTEGYVWRQFLATSTDRGMTWEHEGQLPIGFNKTDNPADGVWPSRACGWIEKRGAVYYLHSIYATALLTPGNEIPAGDYFTDVWSGPTPRGPWTWIRQDVIKGAAGDFDGGYAYGTSVVFDSGTYYLFYGGLNAGRTATNVGLCTGPTPAGPWTKIAPTTGLIPAAIVGEPENMKVFWHPTLQRWLMLVNQMQGLTSTTYNSCFVSTSLTDWTNAKRYDFQHNYPIDCNPAFNIIGMVTPVMTAEALPIFEADGKFAITFDGDTSDSTQSSHHGRHEKFTTIDPVVNALQYVGLDTTQRLLSRGVAHSDFVAEFEIDSQDFGAGAAMSFDFRLDSATGQTGLRLLVRLDNNGDRRLLLQQRTAGAWATVQAGTGTVYAATGATTTYMNRVRVVAVGSTIKGYLGGELQINYASAAPLSGNEIAFMGFNVSAHVRKLKMYRGEAVTVTNVGPGDRVMLRGAAGVPLKMVTADDPLSVPMAHPSFPIREVEIEGEILSGPAATNVALATNGATVIASAYDQDHQPSCAIDNSRVGTNDNKNYWNSAESSGSRILEIDFASEQNLELINVITCQSDPTNWQTPTLTMTFTQYGATDYTLEYWDGSAWVLVPGGNVTANNKVWRQFVGPIIKTSKIRVNVTGSGDGFARMAEVEAWTASGIWGGSVLDAGLIGQLRERKNDQRGKNNSAQE
jgi:hypothetical protein